MADQTDSEFELYEELANKHLRTMKITSDARFAAAKRLWVSNTICFLTTTFASLGLILIPLLDLAKINEIFSSITLTIVQVFLAVCVLVYSTAIATSNFQARSKAYLISGDKIKKIIDEFNVHLIDTKNKGEKPNLERYMNNYRQALEGFENHENIDYQIAYNDYEVKNNDLYVIKIHTKFQLFIDRNFKPYIPFLIIGGLEIGIIFSMIYSSIKA